MRLSRAEFNLGLREKEVKAETAVSYRNLSLRHSGLLLDSRRWFLTPQSSSHGSEVVRILP